MLRLSKKVEYGILSMQYLAENQNKLNTAKEISEGMNLSFEFLAKTLQTLKKNGLVNTIQGMKGGYELMDSPDKISLMDIIKALEKHPEIVECSPENDHTNCDREEFCTIKHPMLIIQKRIDEIFENIPLAEFVREKQKPIELAILN